MTTGRDRVRISNGLAWLGLTLLAACGGRSLDDGVYAVPGETQGGSCHLSGVTYADGTLVGGQCVCFCNNGSIECEAGCSSPGNATGGTAGLSSGGTSGSVATGASTSSGGNISMAGSVSTGGGVSTGASASGGASSGGAATAGAASVGGGGPACGVPPRGSYASTLIDSMEDGDSRIEQFEGRSGNWFSYNDGSGMQYPQPNSGDFLMLRVGADSGNGRYVAATSGAGFRVWGAGMGIVLNAGCPYNASVYKGVRFYARSDQPLKLITLLPTAATNPVSAGGVCREVSATSCFDSFQYPTPVGTAWEEFHLYYSDLVQQGWGTRATFDAATLIGINFQVGAGVGSFSFEIDDLSFF